MSDLHDDSTVAVKMAEESLPELGVVRAADLPVNWPFINDELQANLDVLHQQLSLLFVSTCGAEESFATITVFLLTWHNLLKGKHPGDQLPWPTPPPPAQHMSKA